MERASFESDRNTVFPVNDLHDSNEGERNGNRKKSQQTSQQAKSNTKQI